MSRSGGEGGEELPVDDPAGGDQTMGFFWNVLAKGDGNSFNRFFFRGPFSSHSRL